MPTFDEMLNDIKSKGDGFAQKSTMQWFLNEIKETAKTIWGSDDTEAKESKIDQRTGTEEAAQHSASEETKEGQSERQKARDAVANTNVIETTNAFDQSKIGKLIFYKYDAKTKEKLKYWDMFPICIPFTLHTNGWTGMNLHYLHPMMRARLLSQLMTLSNTTEMDPLTKLNVTYNLLKKSGRFAFFTPCIKRYLTGQLRSRIMVINPKNWVNVALMPLAGFQKMDEWTVYQDSINLILKQQGQWKNG
jgi:hypothetical protein